MSQESKVALGSKYHAMLRKLFGARNFEVPENRCSNMASFSAWMVGHRLPSMPQCINIHAESTVYTVPRLYTIG